MKIQTKYLAITVPDYCSFGEETALKNAAIIAGFENVTIVSEAVALALSYGFFRRKEMFNSDNRPRTIAFIDLGHSKTTVTFSKFGRVSFEILGCFSERNLGIRDFDRAVMIELGKRFAKKYKIKTNPYENIRARIPLRDAVEKARKMLTADKESRVIVDCLAEDEDMSELLKRDDFEDITKELLSQFRILVEQAYAIFKQKNVGITVDSIELVSDGTRIPVIQKIVQEVFAAEKLMRTMNSKDCLS